MRSFLPASLLVAALLLTAGCASSTPESRISRNIEAYKSYPSAVQRKISAGTVDVGFTPEMVRMALGNPSREFTHRTENSSSEVWVYRDNSPRVSLGFGIGSYGRHSATSVGVATSTGGYDRDERMRVIFRDGYVTEVERVR